MTTNKPNSARTVAILFSIILVGVVTYLPAVDNFFISDDFTMLSYLEHLKSDPASILNDPSERFRMASYAYFWACSIMFGLNSTAYYWTGIGLHVLASLLVLTLVHRVTGQQLAGWVGGLFFAAYERHQEAVMWISAVNDLILTIFCVVFLLLWLRNTAISQGFALVVFALALFSKEPAVALLPLSVLLLTLKGVSCREALAKSVPLALMTAAYDYLWLSSANENFFVTDHHYAFGFHFVPVAARTVVRIIAATALFMLPLLLLTKNAYRRTAEYRNTFLFFAAVLCLAVIPYSFLTYLPSIPSRNTYFPSVGLAGLVGLAFATVYSSLPSVRAKRLAITLFVAIISQNIAYVWIKKEPQYRERAAPTRELIEALNGLDAEVISDSLICLTDFPLHPWIATESVKWFTRFDKNHMTFSAGTCNTDSNDVVLRWNADHGLTTEFLKIANNRDR
jgi:hypothetical protein